MSPTHAGNERAPRLGKLALIAAAAIALGGGAFEARADDRHVAPSQSPAAVAAISAEIMVLHATNDGSGIDPQIGNLPELRKPPLSSYNSYKLLNRATTRIDKGKTATSKLPTGRDLLVLFEDVIAPKKAGDPLRYAIAASIGGNSLPQLKVNAKAGEWFFVAGQEYKGGSLVIGIRVQP